LRVFAVFDALTWGAGRGKPPTPLVARSAAMMQCRMRARGIAGGTLRGVALSL